MRQIRPWLYIGKYRETLDLTFLSAYQVGDMLQLAELVKQPGIETLYLPIEDGIPLEFKDLKQGVEFIIAHKSPDKSVLVACGAGISRSTTFALAALKEVEQLSLLQAYQEIKKHHPEAMPHPALWYSLGEYYGETVSYLDLL